MADTDRPLVMIVDDDYRVREALGELLVASGFCVVAFGSAVEYLAYPRPDVPACLILDLELPDASGLDLQQRMAGGIHPPIIFISGHGDIPASVRAIKAGAVDFLAKPFSEEDLLKGLEAALAQDRKRRSEQAVLERLQERYLALTQREREVLPLVVSGLLNKQGAANLGISPITFQIHRSNVMRKMAAASLADLVRIASRLDVPLLRASRTGVNDCDKVGHHQTGDEEQLKFNPITGHGNSFGPVSTRPMIELARDSSMTPLKT